MKYLIIIILTLVSCAPPTDTNPSTNLFLDNGYATQTCTTSKIGTHTTIACPDGSTTTIDDAPKPSPSPIAGPTGVKGDTGTSGHSIVFETTSASISQCGYGGSVILMASDINDNGLLETSDTNIKSTIICNGAPGQNGDDGATGATGPTGPAGASGTNSPYAPVGVIAACGEASSPYKEVLLCLSDGSLLASFSENTNGKNTRLSLIPAGTYGNTDSSGCTFTVSHSNAGSVVSWSAGSNQYSSWVAGNTLCASH